MQTTAYPNRISEDGNGGDHSGRLLSVSELANILNVRPSWVYAHTRMAHMNNFPVLRAGKYVRCNLQDVLAWMSRQNE